VLEILFLIWFCKKLAATARDKNRSGSWGALGALGWIGGEIGGAVVGVNAGAQEMGIYGYAIMGALVGAAVAFGIVASLSKLPDNPDFPSARVI
jgi:hypothetical protein